ncbi:hypothetical protein PTTG_01340 [Puccinia triticina 1-1 BBBD Race 1]|uniref:Secreted protein n=2 Tax=Puccinia triticina TaxID=208348 RepID=A0A180G8E9_PUCT1|nr:uncharacterized protein PtA15_15A318 [Puccinia triticina]OAV88884.1 hypothetical protein PTTG_01340 [Puccinia triticina 1-1 BBBD Race 1]WAQ91925.1 hypothetical protein PtA15_15A318 [Puccinia triticina]WAR62729.1 hypothetical protein PtB15_15B316 [Puccinia triticina]
MKHYFSLFLLVSWHHVLAPVRSAPTPLSTTSMGAIKAGEQMHNGLRFSVPHGLASPLRRRALSSNTVRAGERMQAFSAAPDIRVSAEQMRSSASYSSSTVPSRGGGNPANFVNYDQRTSPGTGMAFRQYPNQLPPAVQQSFTKVKSGQPARNTMSPELITQQIRVAVGNNPGHSTATPTGTGAFIPRHHQTELPDGTRQPSTGSGGRLSSSTWVPGKLTLPEKAAEQAKINHALLEIKAPQALGAQQQFSTGNLMRSTGPADRRWSGGTLSRSFDDSAAINRQIAPSEERLGARTTNNYKAVRQPIGKSVNPPRTKSLAGPVWTQLDNLQSPVDRNEMISAVFNDRWLGQAGPERTVSAPTRRLDSRGVSGVTGH